jgi:hypothetical protein
MSSQYYSATAYVGTPHRNEVEVTIPLVGPAGPQGPAGEGGGGDVESVNGQTGVVVLAAADVGAASTSHTHGNLTNAGAIGTTGGLPVKTGTSGVLEAGAFGTAAGQFAEGNHNHTLSAITDAGTAAAQDANQDLGTGDQVTFQGVTVNGPLVNVIYPGEGVVNCGKLNLDTYAVDLGGGSTGDGFPSIVFGAINGGITLKGPEGDITTSKVINIPNASGTLALSEPSDTTFRVVGSSDATKKVAFEVDGLTAATTRTLTVPDASGTLALTQQSSDMEITDSTKGIILKSANNTRWRITINDDGTLSRAALALMTLLAFATSGMAQVRDMVTDTNGNIITGRTNELTFTNNLRFTPLTNANSRTAIIGTNGALTAGNPPSAAAASNSILRADGAGGSAFVGDGIYVARQRTNGATVSPNNATNTDLIISNVPAGLYWVSGFMESEASAGRTYVLAASNQVIGPRAMLAWFSSGGAASFFNSATEMRQNADGSTGSRVASIAGPLLFTNSTTVSFYTLVSGTNTVQVLSNSFLLLRKLD